MFKYFENLVDPYAPFAETNTPPTRLWPFMREYAKPFKTVFILAGILSIVIAAIEIGLIYYMGRVVDLLQGTPSEVWAAHKV